MKIKKGYLRKMIHFQSKEILEFAQYQQNKANKFIHMLQIVLKTLETGQCFS